MPILFERYRMLPFIEMPRGGTPFSGHGPMGGFALVGLRLHHGDWLDEVAPIFTELLEDGSHGQELMGPRFGGPGGWETTELRVGPGEVVTGIQLRTGTYVDAVRLRATPWMGELDLERARWTSWAGGRGGSERPAQTVDTGVMAVGITGHAGGYIDALTLVVADLLKVPAEAPRSSSSRRAAAR